VKKPDIIDRTRAAVCLLNSQWGTKASEMFAFLALFHSEIPLAKRIKMCRDAEESK